MKICGTCMLIDQVFEELAKAIAKMSEEEKRGLRQELLRASNEHDLRFRKKWLPGSTPWSRVN